MRVLTVDNLAVSYGAIKAVKGISFYVDSGEIVSLIGANGAGKTSTLSAVSNIIKKEGGSIKFNDLDITALPPDKIVKERLIQVPEGRRIFSNLSVLDNLLLGAFLRKDKKIIQKDLENVYNLFPRLKERVKQNAGTLSGGEQQMLAIGRALMSSPTLLLLDEPSMGLAPILVNEIFSIIKRVNEAGVPVLLVEQNAYKALSISNRAYVLETGLIVKEGKASALLQDDSIKKAYLG